jgi:hypothetical protein
MVQVQLGQALPPLGTQLPPQVQNQIAMLTAKAMTVITAQLAANAPGGANDPQHELAQAALQVEAAGIQQKHQAAEMQTAATIYQANLDAQNKAAERATKVGITEIKADSAEDIARQRKPTGNG